MTLGIAKLDCVPDPPVLDLGPGTPSGDTGGGDGEGGGGDPLPPVGTIVFETSANRNVPGFVPSDYDPQAPRDLVVMLHGNTLTSVQFANYMQSYQSASLRGFHLLVPEALEPSGGGFRWIAIPQGVAPGGGAGGGGCCGIAPTPDWISPTAPQDDETFLINMIAEFQATYAVSRVFLVGYSLGGQMAARLLEKHSNLFDAVTFIATRGYFVSPGLQASVKPVLQIHGQDDSVLPLTSGAAYIGGRESLERLAFDAGATGPIVTVKPFVKVQPHDLTCEVYDAAGVRLELQVISSAFVTVDHDISPHYPPTGAPVGGLTTLAFDWMFAHG